MPLSRQTRELGCYGLEVSTATLWELYALLKPASERLAEYILAQPVIGADETSWRLLKGEKKGKSKRWWDGLGKAFRYVQLRKVPLMRFLDDPLICPVQ